MQKMAPPPHAVCFLARELEMCPGVADWSVESSIQHLRPSA